MFQGDNTRAFGGNFLRVYMVYKAPDGTILPLPNFSKIEARVGSVLKTYLPEDYANGYIDINFTEKESSTFGPYNTLYLAGFDEDSQKQTFLGEYVFSSCSRRV